jgi:hypothetical protein
MSFKVQGLDRNRSDAEVLKHNDSSHIAAFATGTHRVAIPDAQMRHFIQMPYYH